MEKDIPRDRISLNNLIRYYYFSYPIVNNVINFSSRFPITSFYTSTSLKDVLEKYDIAKMDDYIFQPTEKLFDIVREIYLYGEAFVSIEDEKLDILNPNYMWVKDRKILIRPDEKMIYCIDTGKTDGLNLSEEDIEIIRKTRFMPENDNIFHIVRLESNYDVRGTSFIYSSLHNLKAYEEIISNKFYDASLVKHYEKRIYGSLLFTPNTMNLLIDEYRRIRSIISKFIIKFVERVGDFESVSFEWENGINMKKLEEVIGGFNE